MLPTLKLYRIVTTLHVFVPTCYDEAAFALKTDLTDQTVSGVPSDCDNVIQI